MYNFGIKINSKLLVNLLNFVNVRVAVGSYFTKSLYQFDNYYVYYLVLNIIKYYSNYHKDIFLNR